jgi:mannose-6-phosphate isomerase-like protein (cupin superfamily)
MIIGFARINIEVPEFKEVSASLNSKWHPHYNTYDYEGDWEIFALRSPGGSTDNILADLAGKDAYADTAHMENFPSVKKLLNSLQCEVMSVRLLNLKAGAIIKQHRDRELSFENGEARLHFPVITNEQVEFYVNDLRVTMHPGECWYINANMPHRVANYGSTDRIHLVIDCKVNDWLMDIFSRSEKTEFEEVVNHDTTFKVIAELRSQQTETANKLADMLELELKNIKQI